MQAIKLGYSTYTWKSRNEYEHVVIDLHQIHPDDIRHNLDQVKTLHENVIARITYQSNDEVGGRRFWYGGELKPVKDIESSEDLMVFNNVANRVLRRMEYGLRAGPHAVIAALKTIAQYIVHDQRRGGYVPVSKVESADKQFFALRFSDGNLISFFSGTDEQDAQNQALSYLAQYIAQKAGWSASKYQEFLPAWLVDGMPMERQYQSAPDARPADEVIQNGVRYFGYSDNEVDLYGNTIEEEQPDADVLAEIADVLGEEE